MFCAQCGSENKDDTEFCTNCGNALRGNTPVGQAATAAPNAYAPVYDQGYMPNNRAPIAGTQRTVPRCNSCGYIGNWEVGPLFKTRDLIIGVGLCITVVGAPFGVGWLVGTAIKRSNKDNREKICPQCKAENLWTFVY